MFRLILVGLAVIAQLATCDLILATYRPPPRPPPIYRFRRGAEQGEPLLINNEDDAIQTPSTSPSTYIDDVRFDPSTRHARSVDSPSARRGGSRGPGSSGGSRDTGPTHPGYNRRNARSAEDQPPQWIHQGDDVIRAPSSADHPFLPQYIDDVKIDPNRRYARSIEPVDYLKYLKPSRPPTLIPSEPLRVPLYAGSASRVARDVRVNIPGVTDRKPQPVIIPNWNPNARTKPWQVIGGHRH